MFEGSSKDKIRTPPRTRASKFWPKWVKIAYFDVLYEIYPPLLTFELLDVEG